MRAVTVAKSVHTRGYTHGYKNLYLHADPYPQLSTASVRPCPAVVQQVRQCMAVYSGTSAGVFDECAGVCSECASIRWSAW